MKTNRSSSMLKGLFLALLATGTSSGLARAQAVQGKFTLPFEVQWGRAPLPAGDYSFKIESTAMPALVTVRQTSHGGKAAIVMAQSQNPEGGSGQSALTVVRGGGKQIVRSLYLAEIGTIFFYATPKDSGKLLAQGPVLIQRIPVTTGLAAGK